MLDFEKQCPNCGTMTKEEICPSCGTELKEEEFSLEDEFGAEFEEQLEAASEESDVSATSHEMAFGFPDWDLLPPND